MNAWDLVVLIYAHPIVRAVLGLLVANVLVGIAAAIKAREFRLAMLGDWLLNRAIPYLIGAGAVQLVILTVPQEWSGIGSALSSAVWLFVVGALLGHILDTARELGLPIPAVLGDQPKPPTTASP